MADAPSGQCVPHLIDAMAALISSLPHFLGSAASKPISHKALSASKDGCDIKSNGCWIKTNVKAEIINKDIIKVNRYGTERYFCSEEHIQAVNKANPKPTYIRYSTLDHGYGKCTKDGWVR